MSEHDGASRTRYVYHYTKASTALELILPSGNVRLNPVDATNDPWEIRPLDSGVATARESLQDLPQELDRLHARANIACLACFCMDDEAVATGEPGSSSYGWARDRMWAQYADNHRGICLWFDRVKLVDSFRSALAGGGQCMAEDVVYSDKNDLPPLDVSVGTADDRLNQYLLTNARARYFRKRQDWAGEREFRLLHIANDPGDSAARSSSAFHATRTTSPSDVPIGRGALVGVTAGCRFPSVYECSLGKLCQELRVPASRIVYADIVFLNPYGPAELDSLPHPWP